MRASPQRVTDLGSEDNKMSAFDRLYQNKKPPVNNIRNTNKALFQTTIVNQTTNNSNAHNDSMEKP